jgi:hypothetical protein
VKLKKRSAKSLQKRRPNKRDKSGVLLVGKPLRLVSRAHSYRLLFEPTLEMVPCQGRTKELDDKVRENFWSEQKVATRLSVTANCDMRLVS